MATSVGCAGSTEELGVIRSPATSLRAGSFSVRVGGVLCCTTFCGAVHAVPGSPSAAAYAEPSTSIGSASPSARAAPGALIEVGQIGALTRAHPHRRRHRRRRWHGQRAAQVHRLLRRQRHGRRTPRAVRALGATRPTEQLRPQIPLRDSRIRWRPRHQHGVPQADGMGEAVRVVLRDGEVGDAELHAGRPVVGGHGGDPHPRRLAVGQRHGQRLAGLVEPQRAGAVERSTPRCGGPARRRRLRWA